jgi:hypothetical protein
MRQSSIVFLCCTLLLVLLVSPLRALPSPPVKWGKVTPEELAFKTCPYDSSAPAVVLCDYGHLSFGIGIIDFDRHRRIKILTRKGLEEATVTIPYYVEDGMEKVIALKAQIIRVGRDGKIGKPGGGRKPGIHGGPFALRKGETLYFSNVAVGDILEYKYTTKSYNIYTLESWCFQSNIPTLHSELVAQRAGSSIYRILLQGRQLPVKYAADNDSRWSLDSLPALVQEPHVTFPLDYAEQVSFHMNVYQKSNGVPERIENHSRFLNQKEHVQQVVNQVLTGQETAPEKLRKLYNHVKKTFTWNGGYGVLADRSFGGLLETKNGNSADLNLYLTVLLRAAGFKAHPALLSTRDHGKLYIDTYLPLFRFNHLVAYAELEGKEILLDATHPLRPYTLLAKNDLNDNAYVLEPEKQRWVKVQSAAATRQVISAETDFSHPAQPVHRFTVRLEGHEAVAERQKFVEKGKFVAEREMINTPYADFKLASSETKAMDDPDEPLLVNLTYQPETPAAGLPDLIYFAPVLLGKFTENPFKNEARTLPVELGYPASYTYVLNLKVPPGYQLQEVPKSTLIKMPGNLAQFRYQVVQQNDQVQLNSVVSFTEPVIPAENYHHLREFYDQVIAKYREVIVLRSNDHQNLRTRAGLPGRLRIQFAAGAFGQRGARPAAGRHQRQPAGGRRLHRAFGQIRGRRRPRGPAHLHRPRGRDPESGKQVTDQELVRNNLALALSCQKGLPVRVIRGGDPGTRLPRRKATGTTGCSGWRLLAGNR